LAALLDELDEVAARHPEVLDTDVREHLREVIEEGYLQLSPAYEVPRNSVCSHPREQRSSEAS
jgi:hypothetical protein